MKVSNHQSSEEMSQPIKNKKASINKQKPQLVLKRNLSSLWAALDSFVQENTSCPMLLIPNVFIQNPPKSKSSQPQLFDSQVLCWIA